ncbi:hypothetical protein DFH28DRAFT_1153976 [Melampsora americana]|nr:hypothetical protein DFH28DRAFT_1153976 [Melampsora americana]
MEAPAEGSITMERKVLHDAYVMRQRKAADLMYSHMTQQYCIMVESEGLIYNPLEIWKFMKEKFHSNASGSKACGINFGDEFQELFGETIVTKLPNLMETTISLLGAKLIQSGQPVRAGTKMIQNLVFESPSISRELRVTHLHPGLYEIILDEERRAQKCVRFCQNLHWSPDKVPARLLERAR